jgi:hypothetical protein
LLPYVRTLDEHPEKMRHRRETVEHPFGTIKARTGTTHFLMKTLPRVASEMALHVLAYNLTRVMNIMGIQPIHQNEHTMPTRNVMDHNDNTKLSLDAPTEISSIRAY